MCPPEPTTLDAAGEPRNAAGQVRYCWPGEALCHCDADNDCPAASYCSLFWGQCVTTNHCASDNECYPYGMQCDEPRDACRP